jgi:hypothetical protein
MVIGNYLRPNIKLFICTNFMPSIFGHISRIIWLSSNRNTKKAELQILVEEQAANLYNGEIKFKLFWSGRCGIAYMDSFSGYFWKSMNNILNYWIFSARIAKRLSIRNTSDDFCRRFIQLENWRNNRVFNGKTIYSKSPENYLSD